MWFQRRNVKNKRSKRSVGSVAPACCAEHVCGRLLWLIIMKFCVRPCTPSYCPSRCEMRWRSHCDWANAATVPIGLSQTVARSMTVVGIRSTSSFLANSHYHMHYAYHMQIYPGVNTNHSIILILYPPHSWILNNASLWIHRRRHIRLCK